MLRFITFMAEDKGSWSAVYSMSGSQAEAAERKSAAQARVFGFSQYFKENKIKGRCNCYEISKQKTLMDDSYI